MNHKPLNWIKENLIFLPSAGHKLKGKKVGQFILPFQEKIIKSALKADGSFNKNVFIGWSRKISKSLIYSWIFNYLLENREGINLVCMASTFMQSNIIYSLIEDQITYNPGIADKNYNLKRETLHNKKKYNNLYRVFSKASSNLGMIAVSAVIGDELGAMQSKENLNSILTGLAWAQDQKPLLLFASNPAEYISHWSYEHLKTLKEDKSWAFYDYSADLKHKPLSVKAARQANPFYDHYFKTKNKIYKGPFDFVNKERSSAKKSSENLLVYRRFQLGQRLSARAYEWVNINDIQIADKSVYKNKNLRKILSFDLALSHDFCSCLLTLYDDKTDKIYFKPFLHLANTENRRPNQKKLFHDWDKLGYITLQNKPAIDKDVFCAHIKSYLKENKISYERTVWDKNLSTGWTESFESNPVLLRGTAYELAHGIRWIEARSKEKKVFFIGKNPALLWMFENAICSQKSKGYVLLDKPTPFDAIDGAFCAVYSAKYFLENKRPGFVGFAV